MYKAAVIGDYDSIYGFASAGMEIIPVQTEAECSAAFKRVCADDYGAVFVTENYASAVAPLITQPLPALMYVPSQNGASGYAKRELHKMVEKAAGADLLQ